MQRSKESRLTVAVCVVTRNRTDHLRNFLASAHKQTQTPDELIIVENASTDDTVEMIKREAPEALLVRLDANVGCPRGRNIAALNAWADLLLFVDDDSTLETNAVQELALVALAHPEAAVIVPQIIQEQNGVSRPIRSGRSRHVGMFTGQCAIRRRVMLEVGMYPQDFMYGGEEQDLAFRLLDRNHNIWFAPSVTIFHYPERGARDRRSEVISSVQGLVAARWNNLPYALAMATTLRTLWFQLLLAIGDRMITAYLLGVASLPWVIARSLSRHKPISTATVRRYVQLQRHDRREEQETD